MCYAVFQFMPLSTNYAAENTYLLIKSKHLSLNRHILNQIVYVSGQVAKWFLEDMELKWYYSSYMMENKWDFHNNVNMLK